MKSKEIAAFFILAIIIFIINLIIKFFKGLIELGSYLAMPIFVVFCFLLVGWIFLEIYAYNYFKSEEFQKLKKKLEKNTNDCNALNQHIEELKKTYLKLNPFNYGKAEYYDDSNFNYKRPKFFENINDNNGYVLECSLTVCRNASLQPIKYLFKYFNVKKNEKTLEMFEEVFNNFSSVEQGKENLRKERDSLINKTKEKVPFLIFSFYKKRLLNNLGLEKINFNEVYFPRYTFKYISPGGNSSMKCDIDLDLENLENIIHFIADEITFRKTAKGQRALMTSSLREKIKKRDHYTCKKCGLSLQKEPNLLLEIDHIIPISKGGITSEKNLQTLCWKCNRKKGSKVDN